MEREVSVKDAHMSPRKAEADELGPLPAKERTMLTTPLGVGVHSYNSAVATTTWAKAGDRASRQGPGCSAHSVQLHSESNEASEMALIRKRRSRCRRRGSRSRLEGWRFMADLPHNPLQPCLNLHGSRQISSTKSCRDCFAFEVCLHVFAPRNVSCLWRLLWKLTMLSVFHPITCKVP